MWRLGCHFLWVGSTSRRGNWATLVGTSIFNELWNSSKPRALWDLQGAELRGAQALPEGFGEGKVDDPQLLRQAGMCSEGLTTPANSNCGLHWSTGLNKSQITWGIVQEQPCASTGIPLEDVELGMKDLHGSMGGDIHGHWPRRSPSSSVHQAAEKVPKYWVAPQAPPRKTRVNLWLELCQISLLGDGEVLFLGKIHVFICCAKNHLGQRIKHLFYSLFSAPLLSWWMLINLLHCHKCWCWVSVQHFRLQLLEWWERLAKSQFQTLWEAATILPKQRKAPLHSGKSFSTGTHPPGLESPSWSWKQHGEGALEVYWECQGHPITEDPTWTERFSSLRKDKQPTQLLASVNVPDAFKYLQFYQWTLIKRLLEMYFW